MDVEREERIVGRAQQLGLRLEEVGHLRWSPGGCHDGCQDDRVEEKEDEEEEQEDLCHLVVCSIWLQSEAFCVL